LLRDELGIACSDDVGGWRIVKTMGSKITRLTPMQGFCAETGGAITLFGATYLGIPRVYESFVKFRTSAVRWGDVSERAFLNARALPFPFGG
jgi:PiT family inorganic phosphate transporter